MNVRARKSGFWVEGKGTKMAEINIDELQTAYTAKLAERDAIYQQVKPITKEIKEMEKKIKTYMRENDLETLVVGPVEFTTRTSKRLKITMEDLEDILPEGTNIDSLEKHTKIIEKQTKH